MDDIWNIVVAVSTALSALFLFLGWYSSWREKRDNVLVTRFMENEQFYVRVRTKRSMLDRCTVVFDNEELLGKRTLSRINIVQDAESFQFWAINKPTNLDEREIVVKNHGKTIYKQEFKEIIRES